MFNEETKDAMVVALSELVKRIVATSGLNASDVSDIIGTYFASDLEAVDVNNTTKLVSPKGANLAAKAAIDDWVGAAPELLDTIQEISNALGGDPDAFNTLMTAINTLRSDLANQGLLVQINFADRPELTGAPLTAYEAFANGIYLGYAPTSIVAVSGAPAVDLDSNYPGLLKVQIRPYVPV